MSGVLGLLLMQNLQNIPTKPKCKHIDVVKINHWWFKLRCCKCEKGFRTLPSNDYFEINLRNK